MQKASFLIILLTILLSAETNSTKIKDNNDTNTTNKHLQKLIEKEKKIKKEQKFYQGDEYNLTETAVDKSTVDKVPLIEPEYDFDITDLYNDQ